MKISRRAVCGLCLSATLLWLPSDSGAVSTSVLCQGLGNGLWGQWLDGTLPKTDATIDKVLKIKPDCPQLDGSIRHIVDEIKANQQKQAGAHTYVQKSGARYEIHKKNWESQAPPYDPSGISSGGGGSW